MTAWARECPCGTGYAYDACCGRLHRGEVEAETPEQLMRARYAAYAVGGREGTDYVFRTWHPRTRPLDVTDDPSTTWTGLTVLDATGDDVEFVATFERDGQVGQLRERSRFEQRAGRWFYLTALSER